MLELYGRLWLAALCRSEAGSIVFMCSALTGSGTLPDQARSFWK